MWKLNQRITISLQNIIEIKMWNPGCEMLTPVKLSDSINEALVSLPMTFMHIRTCMPWSSWIMSHARTHAHTHAHTHTHTGSSIGLLWFAVSWCWHSLTLCRQDSRKTIRPRIIKDTDISHWGSAMTLSTVFVRSPGVVVFESLACGQDSRNRPAWAYQTHKFEALGQYI